MENYHILYIVSYEQNYIFPLQQALFKIYIYLFIWLHRVWHVRSVVAARRLSSSCGVWTPEHAGSVVAACGLSSCGARALEHVGSVVAACGLSCPATCRILVPRPRIEPTSPALEGGFLTTGPPGKSPQQALLNHF